MVIVAIFFSGVFAFVEWLIASAAKSQRESTVNLASYDSPLNDDHPKNYNRPGNADTH
jgi:hypothetical protein